MDQNIELMKLIRAPIKAITATDKAGMELVPLRRMASWVGWNRQHRKEFR